MAEGEREKGSNAKSAPRVQPAQEDLLEAGAPRGSAQTFEVALRRLEEIARHLEEGDLDLQASLALYREARELHGFCVARLTEAEQELQVLLADDRVVPESRVPSSGAQDEG